MVQVVTINKDMKHTQIERIKTKAKELEKNMQWLKDKEGENLRVIIEATDKDIEGILIDMTYKVSEDTQLSSDSCYLFVWEALRIIADSAADSIDNLRDEGRDIEADSYTNQLTSWLAESVNHVAYITQALQEIDWKDGFSLLQVAQAQAKTDVFEIVVNQLEELA